MKGQENARANVKHFRPELKREAIVDCLFPLTDSSIQGPRVTKS